jgi:EpsI family protein
VTNQAFYVLRLSTAAHATALLQFAGIPAMHEGNLIIGSKVVAQVVDTCSGLRSVEMLTFAAIFFVGWFPARRLRQVLLVVLAPAIAYLFNLLRVSVMTLVPTSELSADHAMQGMALFLGAITCLILTDRVLGRLLPARPRVDRVSRRSQAEQGMRPEVEPESSANSDPGLQLEVEPEPSANSEPGLQPEVEPESSADAEPESATPLQGSAGSKSRLGAAAFAVLAVTMLGVSIWMPRWNAPESKRLIPVGLPAELDGWTKTQKVRIDRGFLWTVRAQKPEYWNYEQNGDEVSVFVGYDDRSNRGRSLLSRKNAVPGRGWEVEERSSVLLEPVETPVERVVARSEFARLLTYHWYEGTDGLASEILRALLASDQSPFWRSQPARVIRVATVLGPTPPARMEDEENLRAFASSLVSALRE